MSRPCTLKEIIRPSSFSHAGGSVGDVVVSGSDSDALEDPKTEETGVIVGVGVGLLISLSHILKHASFLSLLFL